MSFGPAIGRPLTRFEYSRYAVETFRVPVPISNGAFGDDIGFGDMKPDSRRKSSTSSTNASASGWISDGLPRSRGSPKYQGREVEFKWSL